MSQTVDEGMSIGELARRAGVPVATVRTWEHRYGLASSARSQGGHRRYSSDDLLRIKAFRELVESGATVAAAARLVSSPAWERGPAVPPSAGLEGAALEAAYSATRALLRVRQPAEVVEILVRLVRELGGDVVDAAEAPAEALPLDLSFGVRAPLLPLAPAYSVARLHLERILPTVLDDARHMVLVSRRQESARRVGRPPGGA